MTEATSKTPSQDKIHKMRSDDYVVTPCRHDVIVFNGTKYPVVGTMMNERRQKVWTIFCSNLSGALVNVCDVDNNTCDFRR